MAEWDPDITIDESAVRELLATRAPELLTGAPALHELARGWDNVVWRAGDMLVRLPVREVAVPGVERELVLLDRLRSIVPLPIPGPTTPLAAIGDVPWSGFAYPALAGVEAVLVELDDAARIALGTQLGTFLHVLHDPGTVAAVDPAGALAIDPLGRADMHRLVPSVRQILDRLGTDAPSPVVHDAAHAVLDAAADLPTDPDVVLVHGDLHVRHLLVDPITHAATGVIDWGDACRGPRSIDLMLYWTLLDAPARAAFTDAYGPVDEATLTRARTLAIASSSLLVLSAADFGTPDFVDGCRRTLLRTLDLVD